MTQYIIIDGQTGLQIGREYNNRRKASHRADKLDIEYGAYRYIVRPVPAATKGFAA